MNDIAYNANPELVAMKQDIADRKFRVMITGMIVGGGLMLAAIAAGAAAFTFAPAATTALVSGASAGGVKALLAGGMALAGGITAMATMKEVKKLEMDEKYLQSYMSGKNYWGNGFRTEVLEQSAGYSIETPALIGAPPLSKHGRIR